MNIRVNYFRTAHSHSYTRTSTIRITSTSTNLWCLWTAWCPANHSWCMRGDIWFEEGTFVSDVDCPTTTESTSSFSSGANIRCKVHAHTYTKVGWSASRTSHDTVTVPAGDPQSFLTCPLGHSNCRINSSKVAFYRPLKNDLKLTTSTNYTTVHKNMRSYKHSHVLTSVRLSPIRRDMAFSDAISCDAGHVYCLWRTTNENAPMDFRAEDEVVSYDPS